MKKSILSLIVFSLILFVSAAGAQNEPKGNPFKKAKDLYNKGEYQQAIPLFKKVINDNPKKADEASYFLGMCHLKLQNYPSSIQSFSEALKLRNDDYLQALRGRAEAQMALKKYDLAEADLKKILEASPGDLDVEYQLGQAQYYNNNFSEAITHLKKVVDARPTDHDAHYFTGWVYYKLKQYDQTIRHFEIYVKLCPTCPEAEKLKEILRSLKG